MTQREQAAMICRMLGIPGGPILDMRRNPNSGMNNDTWIVRTAAGAYLCRVPGEGTGLFCNRMQEKRAYEQLSPMGLTDGLIGYDARTGAKLTVFYPGSRTCDPRSREDCRRAMHLLRWLHGCGARLMGVDNPHSRLVRYARIAEEAGAELAKDGRFRRAAARLWTLRGHFETPEAALRPVHADFLPDNVLIQSDGRAVLIDLEFASMGNPMGDLADFCHDASLSQDGCFALLADYLERRPGQEECRELFLYCACVALMWSAWAAFKACAGGKDGAFFAGYRDRSIDYACAALGWMDGCPVLQR